MNALLRTLLRAAAAAIAAAYVGAGLFLAFALVDPLGLGRTARLAAGILVLLYGCFRMARAVRRTPLAA